MSRSSVLVQKGSVVRIAAIALLTLVATMAGCGDDSKGSLILATTTSTQDSGLLDVLIPAFERDTGMKVKTLAVGSGEALALGERGEADVLLVHSPAAEEELMATGKAGRRRLVMHNDFVIVGPADDPRGSPARRRPTRFGRSRTQRRPSSRAVMTRARTRPSSGLGGRGRRARRRLVQRAGQGMGATLRVADERRGYTLADRGTYLAQPGELEGPRRGRPRPAQRLPRDRHDREAGDEVNVDGARSFADWVVSPEVQATIGTFGGEKYGQALFTPDAGKTAGAGQGGRLMDVIWDAIRDAVQLLVTGDGQTYEIIWLSLRVSVTATAIAFLLGLPLGILLAFGRFRGRRPVLALVNTGDGDAAGGRRPGHHGAAVAQRSARRASDCSSPRPRWSSPRRRSVCH